MEIVDLKEIPVFDILQMGKTRKDVKNIKYWSSSV
jgi:hypothetical protein